jgi:hypothetical protein
MKSAQSHAEGGHPAESDRLITDSSGVFLSSPIPSTTSSQIANIREASPVKKIKESYHMNCQECGVLVLTEALSLQEGTNLLSEIPEHTVGKHRTMIKDPRFEFHSEVSASEILHMLYEQEAMLLKKKGKRTLSANNGTCCSSASPDSRSCAESSESRHSHLSSPGPKNSL